MTNLINNVIIALEIKKVLKITLNNIIMRTKEEMINVLNEEFKDITPRGEFLRIAIKAIIEKYYGKWEKNLEIEIPGDKFWFFVGKFPESIQLTCQLLMKVGICGDVMYDNEKKKLMVKEVNIK